MFKFIKNIFCVPEDQIIDRANKLIEIHSDKIKELLNINKDIEIVVKKTHIQDLFNFTNNTNYICGAYGYEDTFIHPQFCNKNDKKIFIYVESIYKVSFKLKKYFDIRVIESVAHEFRHIRQELDGTNIDDGYVLIDPNASNYKQYSSQAIEIEAREFAAKYIKDNKKRMWKV